MLVARSAGLFSCEVLAVALVVERDGRREGTNPQVRGFQRIISFAKSRRGRASSAPAPTRDSTPISKRQVEQLRSRLTHSQLHAQQQRASQGRPTLSEIGHSRVPSLLPAPPSPRPACSTAWNSSTSRVTQVTKHCTSRPRYSCPFSESQRASLHASSC